MYIMFIYIYIYTYSTRVSLKGRAPKRLMRCRSIARWAPGIIVCNESTNVIMIMITTINHTTL